MTRNSQRDRIPSGDLTAYERWELPLLDENGKRKASVDSENRRVKPLTAEELEAIHSQAVEDGHKQGFEAGKTEGMDQGAREGYRVGYDEGLAAGREAGEQQALEETREEFRQQQQRLEQLMDTLLNPIEQQREATEAALMNLVMALSRSVVHRELQLDSSQIGAVLRHAIATLPETGDAIKIHVHPDDVDNVREAVKAIDGRASVVTDDSLHPGGCLVENSHSLVDFTVEKRFQKVVQQMLDTQLGSDEEQGFGEMDAVMGDMSDFHREVLEAEQEPEPENQKVGSEQSDPDTADDSTSRDEGNPGTTPEPDDGERPDGSG